MSIANLRTQITETQKVRSDLMKWKLFLVAGIGTVGIGIQKSTLGRPEVLFCLIPLVCIYVDSLCAHLSLRIRATGEFILAHPPKTDDERYAQSYESFVRRWLYENRLEPLALHWSTVLLSTLVAAVGVLRLWQTSQPSLTLSYLGLVALIVTGASGIVLTLWIRSFHRDRVVVIADEGRKYAQERIVAEPATSRYLEPAARPPQG